MSAETELLLLVTLASRSSGSFYRLKTQPISQRYNSNRLHHSIDTFLVLALVRKITRNEKLNLGLFVTGALLFFLGIGVIYIAELRIEDSLRQEVTALAGLVTSALGALSASLGYIALTLNRLLKPGIPHGQPAKYNRKSTSRS